MSKYFQIYFLVGKITPKCAFSGHIRGESGVKPRCVKPGHSRTEHDILISDTNFIKGVSCPSAKGEKKK